MTLSRPATLVLVAVSAFALAACGATPAQQPQNDALTSALAVATTADQVGYLRPASNCDEVAAGLRDYVQDLSELSSNISPSGYQCAWGPAGTVLTDPSRTSVTVDAATSNPGFSSEAVRAAFSTNLLDAPEVVNARAVAYSKTSGKSRTVVVETQHARVELIFTGALANTDPREALPHVVQLIEQPQ